MTMMNSKVVQPAYRITLNGKQMPAWMYECCTKVCYKETNSDGGNETLEINFDDPEMQIMDSNKFKENKTVIICEMGYLETDDINVMFMGIVSNIENDYPQSGRITLKITARDIGYFMNKTEVTKTWKGMTYSDIVKSICKKYGIKVVTDDTETILKRNVNSQDKTTKTDDKAKPKTQTYTVKKGDTLWGIAKQFYGDGNKFSKIYDANKNVIKNPNLIYSGQVLTIPDGGNANTKSNDKKTTKATNSKKQKAELVTVSQNGVTDLKFMQNIAKKTGYKLRFDSAKRTCYFVKTKNLPKDDTVSVQYKCGNEKLLAFKPKYNDYDKAMKVYASNYNIKNNKTVSSGKTSSDGKVYKSPTKSETKSTQKESKKSTYKIKSGDTLWGIAKQFYGDGSKFTKIYDANKNAIKNPNIVCVGWNIVIP